MIAQSHCSYGKRALVGSERVKYFSNHGLRCLLAWSFYSGFSFWNRSSLHGITVTIVFAKAVLYLLGLKFIYFHLYLVFSVDQKKNHGVSFSLLLDHCYFSSFILFCFFFFQDSCLSTLFFSFLTVFISVSEADQFLRCNEQIYSENIHRKMMKEKLTVYWGQLLRSLARYQFLGI